MRYSNNDRNAPPSRRDNFSAVTTAASQQDCLVIPDPSTDLPDDRATITLVIEGQERRAWVRELGGHVGAELIAAANSAPGQTVVDLSAFAEYPERDRVTCIEWLKRLRNRRFRAGGSEFPDPIQALASMLNTTGGLERFSLLKRVFLEYAVLSHPYDLEVPAQILAQRIREQGYRGFRVADLVREAKRIREEYSSRLIDEAIRLVTDTLPDAPVHEQSVVPAGWEVTEHGIRGRFDDTLIPSPVVIKARGRTLDGQEAFKLAFRRDARWQDLSVNRLDVADSRRIVGLAARGLAVTSINATSLVQYLADYEQTNGQYLRMIRIVHQLGFDSSMTFFLSGRRVITGANQEVMTADSAAVEFVGKDDGDEQLVEAYRQEGDFGTWKSTVLPLFSRPQMALLVAAACVPPLLAVVGSSNFVVSIAGPTSVGKTSALRVAASVWGCPDESKPGSLIGTCASSQTFYERSMLLRNHHPTFVDERKLAGGDRTRQAVDVYLAASGCGKARGTIKGIGRLESCSSVTFFTGEEPLATFTDHAGTVARVLEVWGSPFGEKSPRTAALVRDTTACVCQHYGHAGPALIAHLLTNRDRWPAWKGRWLALCRHYEQRGANNTVATRQAAHFAVLVLAWEILHEAWGLMAPNSNPVDALWDQLTSTTELASQELVALRAAVEWALTNPDKFDGSQARLGGLRLTPHGGWAGRWLRSTSRATPHRHPTHSPEGIGFTRLALDNILRPLNLDILAVTRGWKERGWLTADSDRCTKKMSVDGQLVNLYAINRAALSAATDGPPPAGSSA